MEEHAPAQQSDHSSGSDEGESRAEKMAEITVAFYNEAARGDPELSHRISRADTTVHMRFIDEHGEAGCTVYLDREPIEAELGLVGEAEIELYGDPATFMETVAGRRAMAMAIASGEIKYKGPVRKFLRVVPIMRMFDFTPYRGATKAIVTSANGDSPSASADDAPPPDDEQ